MARLDSRGLGRRRFLKKGFFAASAMGFSATRFSALMSTSTSKGSATEARVDISPDYGPLLPTRDESTGMELLRLPEGFRYWSFGWTGDPMAGGHPTPSGHDGMAVVASSDGVVSLVRNHELSRPGDPLPADPSRVYDSKGRGGTTTLRFDTRRAALVDSMVSLSGTAVNCSGGPTPWQSWLSCEEIVAGTESGYEKDHGWVFEVPADGISNARPLYDMGRFKHEAIAIDPESGFAYLTQDDRRGSGLYRFLPNKPGRFDAGGRLQMLKLMRFDRAILGKGSTPTRMSVEWVEIDDPRAKETSTFEQGRSKGGAQFLRLEGIWFDSGRFYFTDTAGGSDPSVGGFGRVWEYDPASERLELIFESPSQAVANGPDNIAVSPRGGIVLCEDRFPVIDSVPIEASNDEKAGEIPNRLLGLTRAGQIYPFAENALQFDATFKGLSGDYRYGEWAGSCFFEDWLFANIQQPGVTFAITGPWRRGSL